jgi:hypothetical protein
LEKKKKKKFVVLSRKGTTRLRSRHWHLVGDHAQALSRRMGLDHLLSETATSSSSGITVTRAFNREFYPRGGDTFIYRVVTNLIFACLYYSLALTRSIRIGCRR